MTIVKMHLTTTRAAKILGVSNQTINNYRKRGILPGFQYIQRGRWLFKFDDVIRFKEGRES